MTRQHKTPAQRAQEALDLEERRVKRLTAKRNQLDDELADAEHELKDAVRRRDYLKQHPDLNPNTPNTNRTTIQEQHA